MTNMQGTQKKFDLQFIVLLSPNKVICFCNCSIELRHADCHIIKYKLQHRQVYDVCESRQMFPKSISTFLDLLIVLHDCEMRITSTIT
jgi:hypothetical protein